MTTALRWETRDDVTLVGALSAYASVLGEGRCALLYSPSRCVVASVADDGNLLSPTAFRLDEVFEARVFGADAELRWLHTGGGSGRAALVNERHGAETREVLDTKNGTYLVWGSGTGEQPMPGWSVVSEARVGSIAVPVADLAAGGRVVLRYTEYLAPEDEHGNVAVIEERLSGMGVA
jgi:CRISPR-associated protein (TIGR03984 family)